MEAGGAESTPHPGLFKGEDCVEGFISRIWSLKGEVTPCQPERKTLEEMLLLPPLQRPSSSSSSSRPGRK